MSRLEEEALKASQLNKYITPDGYTADNVIFTIISEDIGPHRVPKKTLKVMLIQRREKNREGKPNIEGGKWALPGGFIDSNETAYEAALRELEEETKVTVSKVKHFGVYDKNGRDPRGWIISNAHYAIVPEHFLNSREAADDAKAVELFDMNEVAQLDLAFDHRQIIDDALWFVQKDMATTTLAREFLPTEFVISELQGVLLAVLEGSSFIKQTAQNSLFLSFIQKLMSWIKLDAQFFRKVPTLPFIEKVVNNGEPKKTNKYSKGNAQLYKFNDIEPYISIYNTKY